MPSDPQTPDGGYALTPEQSGTGAADATTGDASTAHHEELLRTEALAARRGNRAIARFAAVGLVAALAVGFVTWRNSVPADNNADDSPVVDSSVDTSLRPTRTEESPEPAPRTTTHREATPPPVTIGGVAPLSEDPYLPPNAWNGGDSLDPVVPSPEDTTTQDTGGETAPDTTDENPSSPEYPVIPGLPSLPDFPDFPDHNGGGSSTPTEPTEDPESGEDTGQAGTGEGGNGIADGSASENGGGAGDAGASQSPNSGASADGAASASPQAQQDQPSEPTELGGQDN